MKIEFIDATRAYYQAAAAREIYVELPPGDREEGMCGELLKPLQGTRGAAMNWEATYSNVLGDVGFINGKGSPCIFYHPQRNIKVSVHGDDFTLLGQEKDLDWCRHCITSKQDCKVRGRICPDDGYEKSIKLLNRVIEWTKGPY